MSEQNSKVNQAQIGDTKTAVFWHGSQSLTIFTSKEKVTLDKEETYKLLSFLQSEMRDSTDMSNREDHETALEIDLFAQDVFTTQYALARKIGDRRFGSECNHAHVSNGHCQNCLRRVV